MSSNPFLDSAFEIHGSRLTPELIVPAIDKALVDAQAAVNAVASRALKCYKALTTIV